MAYAIHDADVQQLRKLLLNLIERTESDDCIICDTGGFILAEEGQTAGHHPQIAALGAGVFSASRELARLIGETDFNTVFHQGTNKSIFISAVNSEILLVNIFSSTASVGLVKLYTTPAAAECRVLFDAIKVRNEKDGGAGDHRLFVLRDKADVFTPKNP